jgi:hypothetical protein
MKMLTHQHSKEEIVIREKFDAYEAWVFDYAKSVFDEKILPWLKKYHLVFMSGNGAFYIGWTDMTPKWFIEKYGYVGGIDSIDTDNLPKRIQAVLDSEVLGMSNCLGSLMPDYSE